MPEIFSISICAARNGQRLYVAIGNLEAGRSRDRGYPKAKHTRVCLEEHRDDPRADPSWRRAHLLPERCQPEVLSRASRRRNLAESASASARRRIRATLRALYTRGKNPPPSLPPPAPRVSWGGERGVGAIRTRKGEKGRAALVVGETGDGRRARGG